MGRVTTLNDAYKRLAAADYEYALVETYNAFSRKSKDFMGFADILAIHPDIPGVLAVQTCALDRLADHIRHLCLGPPAPKVEKWLQAGNRLECWGWSLKGSKGKRKRKVSTDRLLVLHDGEIQYYECRSELPAMLVK